MGLKTPDSGLLVKAKVGDAIKVLRAAVDLGDPIACYELGMTFNTKQPGIGNIPEAEKLLKQAADKGYCPGMGRYASLALNRNKGHPTEADIAEGLKYYKMSSDHGVPLGMATLADFYRKGTYVNQDIREAVRLMKLASDSGFAPATQALAELYAFGEGEIAADAALTVRYVERLENGKGNEAKFLGYVMRAMLHQRGIGCEQGDEKAEELLALASMKRYVREQYDYASRLEKGFLCRRDIDAADMWTSTAELNAQASFRRSAIRRTIDDCVRNEVRYTCISIYPARSRPALPQFSRVHQNSECVDVDLEIEL
jgi:TPR repeat protein